MKKLLKKWDSPVFWAAYCAVIAVWNFTAGFISGHWWSFAMGVLMVALFALNIFQIKRRKAGTPVASNDLSRYMSGGYIGGAQIHTNSTSFKFTPAPTPPANPPGEFKGLPFDLAIGEVYGLRMWRMDQYGRLRARNWEKAPPWRPGVNVAKCVEQSDADFAYHRLLQSMTTIYGSATTPAKPTPKTPHDTPSEDCACGFYAYTESHHAETLPYKDSHVVLGVIKGTGRTLMGTKGLRCEKAEIVAFRDPTRGGTKNDPWRVEQLANLKRLYPDVPILESRAALLEFAPLTNTLPDPSTDEFWDLP